MPVYEEIEKDKEGKPVVGKDGKPIAKKIDGKKIYYIRAYITDENGEIKQITRHNKDWVGLAGQREAQQEENKLKNKKFFREYKFQELAEKYLNNIEKDKKRSTFIKYRDNIKFHIEPFFKNKNISEINTNNILEFKEWLNERLCINTNKLLSFRFKKDVFSTLSSMLDYGIIFCSLEKNVAKIVGNFKEAKGTQKKEMQFLTEDEFKKFIEQEKSILYKNFFTILFYTGMRRGELLALTYEDIEGNYININKSLNPKNGDMATVPKTNKSNRKILMLPTVEKILKKEHNSKGVIFGLDNIKTTTLCRKCKNNCKNANIDKYIRIHDFRHSFASFCINKNVPIHLLSSYLGHENISTTLDIYSHLYPDSQEKMIQILQKQDQKQDQENVD